jgi:tRNA (cytidine/uridine-2'-O-)-methyltransferase
MEIVLYQPEIPQNTGNIVRTCSVTGCSLTLVRPLGFSVSDKTLKRAGLDYWNEVDIKYIDDLEEYLNATSRQFYFFSSKAKQSHFEISYTPTDLLIFGSETSGLDPKFYKKWPERFVKIPMLSSARCLNLSNSVAIAVYEALRQNPELLV